MNWLVILLPFSTAFLFLTLSTLLVGASTIVPSNSICSPRQYLKSGTCVPCTNCQSQGLDVLSPCSSVQDEICIFPVYGMTKIYSPFGYAENPTPGPTHRVRQRVLRGGYVRNGSIERLRSAYFYQRAEDENSKLDGRIKYEEDDDSGNRDSLHSDLEAIEQELLREKARENELNEFISGTSTTKGPPKKSLKELRRRRKKKNKKSKSKNKVISTTTTAAATTTMPSTTTSTTTTTTTTSSTTTTASTTIQTTDRIQEQVFGQIIHETSFDSKKKPLEDVGVIEQVLIKEEQNYSTKRKSSMTSSVLRSSKTVFGISTKTWTIIASLFGAITFIVICILVGLKKVYSVQTFKILDNRASPNAGHSTAAAANNNHSVNGQPPSMDTYVQSLVSSRTSSFHRSTESRLTSTSTVPTSPNTSSPSSPNNRQLSGPGESPLLSPSLTYVDSNGRTNIRRTAVPPPVSARELPV